MRFSRRAVIAALAAPPLLRATSAFAQPARRPVIGFVITEVQNTARYEGLREAFRDGLKSQGYVEDVNVRFDAIIEPDPAKLRQILSAKPPDLLVASADAAVAAKTAAPNLPLVFSSAYDPVAAGLVASLS